MPRALRCSCNYTFEYERAPGQEPRRASPQLHGALLASAVAAAVAAFALMRAAIEGAPDPHGQVGYLLIPFGVFAIAGAMAGWRWFFTARRARLVVAVLGLTGARFFYALLGGALIGAGVTLLMA